MSSPTIAPVRRAKFPGAGDDVLAGDVALVGLHHPAAARRPLDRGDDRVAVDLAAHRARALGERLGEVGRLDIAVVRMLDRADDAVGLAERPGFLHLRGGEELHLDADRLGDALVEEELVHAVSSCGRGGCSRPGETRHSGRFPPRACGKGRQSICGSGRPSSSC